jgi:hypothetical protein
MDMQVRDLVGEAAEELIHLFCIVPRQQLIFDNLLLTFSDERLLSTLHEYDQIMGGDKSGSAAATSNQYESVGKATHDHVVVSKKMEQLFSTDVNSHSGARRPEPLIPPEGMLVKHIRTGEDVWVPRRVVAIFLLLTMADFADQFFGWQVHRINPYLPFSLKTVLFFSYTTTPITIPFAVCSRQVREGHHHLFYCIFALSKVDA